MQRKAAEAGANGSNSTGGKLPQPHSSTNSNVIIGVTSSRKPVSGVASSKNPGAATSQHQSNPKLSLFMKKSSTLSGNLDQLQQQQMMNELLEQQQ